MNNVGIDKLSFYTSRYALDLDVLAKAHQLPDDFYHKSIGQYQIAVSPPDEDIVTLAANAGAQVLEGTNINDIEMLLFATETGIDQSKAAGLYVHKLLNLPSRCRVMELKQACYSATNALQLAKTWLAQHPDKKVLLIAADIARYDLGTPAEASQGAGAVAMLLSNNPKLLTIDNEYGLHAEDAMDFWRPNYRREAFVEGKLSCELYLKALRHSWEHYFEQSQRDFSAHAGFCYHVPVPRLAEKAHQRLAKIAGGVRINNEEAKEILDTALYYSRRVGNTYTGSLYMSLASLLENDARDLSGKRISLYSYGSGCTGELFSVTVTSGYQDTLNKNYHQSLIKNRDTISYDEFKTFFNFKYPTQGETLTLPKYRTGRFRLATLSEHKRIYEPCNDN